MEISARTAVMLVVAALCFFVATEFTGTERAGLIILGFLAALDATALGQKR